MTSKSLLAAAGILTTAFVIAVASFSNESPTIDYYSKAASTQKEFIFDQSVASQVQYGGNETTVTSYVETGISSPIATRLYRESGANKEYSGKDGCFFSADYSNKRTFAFEAGLNNLVGFEIQFKYNYNAQFDGDFTHFNYNVTMTFYHGKEVVDIAEYSLDSTVRDTIYTHTWSKGNEISEKIDYVKCSLANDGGSSKDDWRVLKINYFKVTWNC